MGKAKHKRLSRDSGIAIGPILFIIALLGILAAAISAGASFFTTGTSGEKAKAQATAVIEQAVLLQEAVTIVGGNGCEDTQISFENGLVAGYTNPNAPADHSCHVFDPQGGGTIWPNPPSGLDLSSVPLSSRQYLFTGYDSLYGFGKYNTGDESEGDLIMLLPGIPRDVCLKIDSLTGFNLSANEPLQTMYMGLVKFTGSYDRYGFLDQAAIRTANNIGKTPACVKVLNAYSGIPAGTYLFFHVLHIR